MNAKKFVTALSRIKLENVFNPYADRCAVHDLPDAPKLRRANLISYLTSIENLGSHTLWMGRDLGYRGGRRTGLALTDEAHLNDMLRCYPGCHPERATVGPAAAERTATEIWTVIRALNIPPLLWNVFPFHPHESDMPMTNRRFSSKELKEVDELNRELVDWLRIRRIICIGQDASKYAATFGIDVECVRHPSYGGVREFRSGVRNLYGDFMNLEETLQPSLF